MTNYGERLRTLQEKLAEKKHYDARALSLRKQLGELQRRVRELDTQRVREQADVDKLEGRSLAAFFYAVVGKKDEKLDQERQEAYAAAVKYDVAERELADVQEELSRCEAALGQLRDVEKEYAALMQETAAAIRASGDKDAEALLQLEQEAAELRRQETELREAISAGNGALRTAEDILSSLNSAQGWGTWDMIGGGGIIADAIKHNHLDEAQAKVERLQVQLRRFKTELADVTVYADIRIEIDSFLRFADFFFDGLFSAWSVQSKIGDAQNRVHNTQRQIRQVLARLDQKYAQAQQAAAANHAERENLILNTEL